MTDEQLALYLGHRVKVMYSDARSALGRLERNAEGRYKVVADRAADEPRDIDPSRIQTIELDD